MTEKKKKPTVAPGKPVSKIKLKLNQEAWRAIAIVAVVALLAGAIGGAGLYKLKYKISEKVEKLENKITTVQEQSATIDVVKKVSPSVVSITAEQSRLDFFGNVRNSKSSGTGFIVTTTGIIITNKHVVSGETAQYSVFTQDGKEYQAKIVALDPNFDLAFIKIDANNLVPAELGDSNSIEVGQKAIAIGNALGQYQNTVTAGVVSAIGRAVEAGDQTGSGTETLENMIQTDAAINPGNSGGPLVDISGRVFGINTAVDSQAQGIGFALPINLAKSVLPSVLEKGKIIRPMLGVRYVNITKEFAARNNLKIDHGALIYASGSELAIIPGSPAAKAGLREGDIITKIGTDILGQGKSLVGVLSRYSPGDKIKVVYTRDKIEHAVDITLAESK